MADASNMRTCYESRGEQNIGQVTLVPKSGYLLCAASQSVYAGSTRAASSLHLQEHLQLAKEHLHLINVVW
jgi:hypothetical protein